MSGIKQSKINKAIKHKTKCCTEYISKVYNISFDVALVKFISTLTYEMLSEPKTEVFCESDECVIDMLCKELNK